MDLGEAVDGRDHRARPGGEHDRTPRDEHGVVVDGDPALSVQARLPAVQGDAAAVQPLHLGRVVEVVDDLVATVEHRLHGEGADRDSGNPLILGEQLAGSQQRLGGHARPVGALATDQLALDQRGVKALPRRGAAGDLAGGPRADHDDVVFVFAHGA